VSFEGVNGRNKVERSLAKLNIGTRGHEVLMIEKKPVICSREENTPDFKGYLLGCKPA